MSGMFLQNVSTGGDFQPAMAALGMAEHILDGRDAIRIHGGGFGGSIQCFVPTDALDGFISQMDAWLGQGSCRHYHIAEEGGEGRMALAEDICALVDYACDCDLIGSEDRVWAYNSVLEAVGATGPAPAEAWLADDRYPVLPVGVAKYGSDDPDAAQPYEGAACSVPPAPFDLEGTLACLSEEAVANGAAEDTASGRDRAAMRVMGRLTPRPSEVALAFDDALASQGPRVATSWFYDLCCNVGYVRRAAIARNIAWETPTHWGSLEITINRSKPEKDPRDIARVGAVPPMQEQPLIPAGPELPYRLRSVAGMRVGERLARLQPACIHPVPEGAVLGELPVRMPAGEPLVHRLHRDAGHLGPVPCLIPASVEAAAPCRAPILHPFAFLPVLRGRMPVHPVSACHLREAGAHAHLPEHIHLSDQAGLHPGCLRIRLRISVRSGFSLPWMVKLY